MIGYDVSGTWTSKSAQNNGPIFQNKEYRQYRVHCILGILEVQVDHRMLMLAMVV